MTPQTLAIAHVVHEYANFVSSAEMVLKGKDINGATIAPPLNTHVSHAFYMNCRKMADFLQNKCEKPGDDVVALHFAVGYRAVLPKFDECRVHINKQLAHVTYTRDVETVDLTSKCKGLYDEIRRAWQEFRGQLPTCYARDFEREVLGRKAPNSSGDPSEFRSYDLD